MTEHEEASPHQESCQTGQRHLFVLHRPKVRLVIKVDEVPVAHKAYTLRLGEHVYRGMTDSDGRLEHDVEDGCRSGHLDVPDADLRFALTIGRVPPITDTRGVQIRLNNLGYECGVVDAVAGPRTQAALRRFQSTHDLRVTGEADAATRARLAQEYGG